jgi:hypothetical protein
MKTARVYPFLFRPILSSMAVLSLMTGWIQETQAQVVFSDNFATDTSANYIKVFVGNLQMAYAAPEQALRFFGNEQSFWYVNSLSGVYDGSVSARVTVETSGTPDHGGTGNGLGVQLGLRVDPGSWGHWGVWGGLYTIWGNRYAIIDEGAPTVWATAVPYAYQQGQTYDLRLDLWGSQATLFINGVPVVQRAGITQPSSGLGTAAIWASDGDSSSGPSSFLVDDLQVIAKDTTPPVIKSISANPSMLWPVNHKMVKVTVAVDATDNSGQVPTSRIVGVASNEPINGPGDGNTNPDWQLTDDPLVVLLRAERSGSGSGRVYTIQVNCTDASGNVATGTVGVTVPHDQGKKK